MSFIPAYIRQEYRRNKTIFFKRFNGSKNPEIIKKYLESETATSECIDLRYLRIFLSIKLLTEKGPLCRDEEIVLSAYHHLHPLYDLVPLQSAPAFKQYEPILANSYLRCFNYCQSLNASDYNPHDGVDLYPYPHEIAAFCRDRVKLIFSYHQKKKEHLTWRDYRLSYKELLPHNRLGYIERRIVLFGYHDYLFDDWSSPVPRILVPKVMI
jgi:hypothetical protein